MDINHNCYYEQIGNDKPIKLEDLPFDIPDNWTWIRFPNLVNFVLGKTPERHNNKYWNNGKYPWFSIADMKDKTTIYTSKEKISEQSYHDNFSSKLSPVGTLLMSFKLTVGRVSILGVDAVHNEAIISIFPYYDKDNSIRDWLFYTLGVLVDYVEQTDAIKGSTLNKEKMSKMLIPIPSINEQKRIIDKLNSFEPILNYYNELEIELTKMENEFSEKLKKSVLQYAIEGKLVKQDDSDEPASVLLERIKAEKDFLIKEGKIKREKNDNNVIQNDDKNYYENNNNLLSKIDVPFSIPNNWTWVKSQQLIKPAQYGYNGAGLTNGKTKLLRITDIQNGTVNWGTLPYCNITEEQLKIYQIQENDIFIARTGGTIGKSFRLNEHKDNVVFAGYLIRFSFINPKISEYVELFLNTPLYWSQVADKSAGTGQPNINGVSLSNLFIPIPPLTEQERITEKIKTIFDLI